MEGGLEAECDMLGEERQSAVVGSGCELNVLYRQFWQVDTKYSLSALRKELFKHF